MTIREIHFLLTQAIEHGYVICRNDEQANEFEEIIAPFILYDRTERLFKIDPSEL